jgi:hypothetical protein
MLLTALPGDGSSVGNYSLRSELELDDRTYAEAKRELRDKGLIKVGKGYGGTVARADDTQVVKERPRAGLVKLEKDLYEPFADWLKSSLEDQDLAFAEARITALPRGYRRSSGRWSRPDVTAVQVSRYEWLPEIAVELSTLRDQASRVRNEARERVRSCGSWALGSSRQPCRRAG